MHVRKIKTTLSWLTVANVIWYYPSSGRSECKKFKFASRFLYSSPVGFVPSRNSSRPIVKPRLNAAKAFASGGRYLPSPGHHWGLSSLDFLVLDPLDKTFWGPSKLANLQSRRICQSIHQLVTQATKKRKSYTSNLLFFQYCCWQVALLTQRNRAMLRVCQ